MYKIKWFIFIPLILIFIFGCSVGTIKSEMKNPDFTNKISPIREIRTLVFYDSHWTEEEIEILIDETNQILEPQVGIRMMIIKGGDIRCK